MPVALGRCIASARTASRSAGELHALHGDAFYFGSADSQPALLHGDFASDLLVGLPWFVNDRRPRGFLGRAFAQRRGRH